MRKSLRFFCLGLVLLAGVGLLQAEELVLQPGSDGKDTYICECLPDVNNPNGSIDHLYQGQFGICFDRFLIQFDLSQMPDNMVITSAILSLRTFMGIYGSPSGQATFHRILEEWDETGVTFNNQPQYELTPISVLDWPPGANYWLDIDVTELVQAWYAGTFDNYGIYGFSQGTTGTCCMGYYSSDHSIPSERPKLTISYYNPTVVQPVDLPTPEGFSLSPNYPNPFNPNTTVNFSLPAGTDVSLVVYDLCGAEVGRLVDSYLPAGSYQAIFNADPLGAGIYLYRMIAGNYTASGKMLLLK